MYLVLAFVLSKQMCVQLRHAKMTYLLTCLVGAIKNDRRVAWCSRADSIHGRGVSWYAIICTCLIQTPASLVLLQTQLAVSGALTELPVLNIAQLLSAFSMDHVLSKSHPFVIGTACISSFGILFYRAVC